MKIKRKGKPPGRPWHKVKVANNIKTKVCLVCLRRYEERLEEPTIPPNPNSNGGATVTSVKDPLGDDDPVTQVKLKVGDGPVAGTNCEANHKKDGLYPQFLHILNRHFKMDLKNFRSAAIKNQVASPFCDQCLDYVENLCDLYNEWNKIKLLLYWRVCQIGDAIKKSKKDVSYKLSVTLTKSLSNQLFVVSSNSVNLLRKRMSLLSSNSSVKTAHETPKVLLNKNSCLLASQNKLQFPLNLMQQFMKSLIVIFTLATPEMKKERKSPCKSKSTPLGESKRYNAAMKIKSEKHGLKMEHGEDADDVAYSPANSGPASPVDNNDDDNPVSPRNEPGKDSDSDWSGHKNSDDSDVEFSVNKAALPRRWNLRKRKSDKRIVSGNDDTENDPDFSLQLPPLRGARPARREIDESERTFACNLCGVKFTSDRYMRRHLAQAHSFFVHYPCPKCGLKFKMHKDLLLHKKKAHRPDPSMTGGKQLPYKGVTTSCTVCQKVFPSRVKMLKHRKTHKLMQVKHTCEICGKVVMGQFRIDFHRKAHERQGKFFRCSKCSRKFLTQEGLDAHFKLHEDNPNWNPTKWSRKLKGKSEVGPRMGIYKCDIDGCDKAFYKEANLTVHKSLHASSFTCVSCEKVFMVPREFRRHLLKEHEKEEKFHFCLHCDKSFTVAQTYEFHLKFTHPSKAMLICDEDYCTEEFKNTEDLLEHLKTHLTNGDGHNSQISPEGEIKLESDKIMTSDANDDIATAEDMKLGIYTCDRCKWSFCRKLHLTLHQLIHTPRNDKNMFECTMCDKMYRVVDSLQTHVNTIHGSKIKPYLCKICGVRFHRKESFIPHMKAHSEGKSQTKIPCTKCDETFNSKKSLNMHMTKTHKESETNAHTPSFTGTCEDCGESFDKKILLLRHRHQVHGMEKPHKCDHENCDQSFFLGFQLNKHKTFHKPAHLQCPMCPKMFRQRTNLTDHVNAHTQEKNHVCHICGKAFVKKTSLSIHLHIHNQEKNYKCPHCPKAFCRSFVLKCHIRTHTKEKPYVCNICGKAFGQYPSMRNHLKIHERLNSTIVERRPFQKSVGVGAPLVKNEGQSDSGIIAEALKAALNSNDADDGVTQTADDIKEDASESDNDEVEVQPKRKSTRKKQQKNLICGFCGKAFAREKPYNAHLERHLTIDAVVEPALRGESINTNTQVKEDYTQHLLSNEPEPLHVPPVPEPVFVPTKPKLETSTFVPEPEPAVVKRKRGRPRKDSNMPPGKRLEQIVMEVATNNHVKTPTVNNMTTNAGSSTSTQVSQQRQFPQVTQQQFVPSHIQSPPPMQMAQSPYSERSDSVSSTMSNNPPTPTPNPISFMSPFMYANPYLLPLGNQQQPSPDYNPLNQQNFSPINFNQSRQHVSSSFPPTTSQSSYPPQMQYHNMPQLQQQSTSTTLPQDLSKHSYSTFFANPR